MDYVLFYGSNQLFKVGRMLFNDYPAAAQGLKHPVISLVGSLSFGKPVMTNSGIPFPVFHFKYFYFPRGYLHLASF